ncbi:hypothetical protein DMH04_30810 [Kibdelosporangium aridum]|uniref:IgA Peptidase M64 n=1 Tax=Kibdelosporangium aridum TaxID=2030 RepID=A0A428Z2P5_KIBAR|nr:hypothetical protein [Kibdelosporangium aridum]RSM79993.1 hypothetical protein DMH04_30810 [Kibdelosporangium aridum]
MAVETVDLFLLPHADLHVALTGAPQLRVSFMAKTFDDTKPDRYGLEDLTSQCVFEFFAPHNEAGKPGQPGKRFDNLPSINPSTGQVTATTPGVYLFQARWNSNYIVGRLQVHDQITAWWFGNDSITTALDPDFAHAQPSIYAKFSDDGVGADLVGDITGHGYVGLAPDDPTKLAINQHGRVRGIVETLEPPAEISGTFLGQTKKLPVRVVDYGKARQHLVPVQTPDVPGANDMANIVFIPEGFKSTKADSDLFDSIVTAAVREIFDKPRHQPYAMLEGSFNIFKAFIPSQEHLVTCGFRVTDENLDKAIPIPFNGQAGSSKNSYTMQELVAKVGLPMYGEQRPDPLTIWKGQSLKDFDPSRVDTQLIERWKKHYATGILHARDTVFGMQLGSRPADRPYGSDPDGTPPVVKPVTDEPSALLSAYVARMYEFYDFTDTRILTPDPRRHALERHGGNRPNPGASIMRYLAGLKYAFTPFTAIGENWVPDASKFKRSRGLVAMICYDDLDGGTNIDGLTTTAQTMRSELTTKAVYADPVVKRELRRREPPKQLVPDLVGTVNTIAHEFGHSFNLGDEYETRDGDGTAADATEDVDYDNLAVLGFVRAEAKPSRKIDAAKVKWLGLPRMTLSAKLMLPSQNVPGGIRVTIDPRYMGKWVEAKKNNAEVHLRNFVVTPGGQQLPLSTDPGQLLTGLKIGDIAEAAGTVTLTGAVSPLPRYERGSTLYVPLKDGSDLVSVVHKAVRKLLTDKKIPLNAVPINDRVSTDKDKPIDVDGFTTPCDPTQTLGVFEGGNEFSGGFYRPAGACKMRDQDGTKKEGRGEGAEFCYVCKWLIVNRVDPDYHAILSGLFYPKGCC